MKKEALDRNDVKRVFEEEIKYYFLWRIIQNWVWEAHNDSDINDIEFGMTVL